MNLSSAMTSVPGLCRVCLQPLPTPRHKRMEDCSEACSRAWFAAKARAARTGRAIEEEIGQPTRLYEPREQRDIITPVVALPGAAVTCYRCNRKAPIGQSHCRCGERLP